MQPTMDDGATHAAPMSSKEIWDTLPSWTPYLFIANALVVLPLFVLCSYTFGCLMLTLAVVEDEPAWTEPAKPDEETLANDGYAAPTTRSIRRTIHLLISQYGSLRGLFRALPLRMLMAFVMWHVPQLLTMLFVPRPLAHIAAGLACIQLRAVWVHTVITPPEARYFWSRLPSFLDTLRRAGVPVAQELLVTQLGFLLHAWLVTPPYAHFAEKHADPEQGADFAWDFGILIAIATAFSVCVAIIMLPFQALTQRSLASLLPEDERPIVRFDREAVHENTMVIAGNICVPRRIGLPSLHWRRLVKFYLKGFVLFTGVALLVILGIMPVILARTVKF